MREIKIRTQGSEITGYEMELWIGELDYPKTGDPSVSVYIDHKSFMHPEEGFTVRVKGSSFEHTGDRIDDFVQLIDRASKLAQIPVDQLLETCKKAIAERKRQN